MSTYAIVIGISHYKLPSKGGLKQLDGAIPDAIAVAKWLKDSGQVDEKNIRLLTSKVGLDKVIKHDIDTAIADIWEEIMENNIEGERLYFYFAGHGYGVESDNTSNALCMSNWTEYIFDAAVLSSSDYKTKFTTEGLFKEVVMWLDCCRNTKLFATKVESAGVKPRGTNTDPKYFVAFGTTYDNKAFEAFNEAAGAKEPRGIFTTVLLKGLNGAAIGTTGDITAESLADYLAIHVQKEASDAGFIQKPSIHKNTNIVDNILFN